MAMEAACLRTAALDLVNSVLRMVAYLMVFFLVFDAGRNSGRWRGPIYPRYPNSFPYLAMFAAVAALYSAEFSSTFM